jgi:hypothetical protein
MLRKCAVCVAIDPTGGGRCSLLLRSSSDWLMPLERRMPVFTPTYCMPVSGSCGCCCCCCCFSDAWLALREGRLTGSALCNVLDWFYSPSWPSCKGKQSDAVRLWQQKLKLAPPTLGDTVVPLAVSCLCSVACSMQLCCLTCFAAGSLILQLCSATAACRCASTS